MVIGLCATPPSLQGLCLTMVILTVSYYVAYEPAVVALVRALVKHQPLSLVLSAGFLQDNLSHRNCMYRS